VILAGEVGGTHTRLALFRQAGGALRRVREASYSSRCFRSLEALVDEFLSHSRTTVRRCVIGVAGPVAGGTSHVVNLRWPVDERKLERALGTAAVRVINDVEAAAWGVLARPSCKTASLTPGLRSRPGNAALIAAGTGLGMALLHWDGKRHHAQASEGGHQTFGPRDDLEIELSRFLRRRHGRVSLERAISGPAVSAIYEFLIESGRGKRTRKMDKRLAAADDPNVAISAAALGGDDAVARKALKLFVSLYGAAAGDLALVARATGGVYVGGGIAPEILPALKDGAFIEAFRDKGRLSPFVSRIPVRVILDRRIALLGAATCATTLGG